MVHSRFDHGPIKAVPSPEKLLILMQKSLRHHATLKK